MTTKNVFQKAGVQLRCTSSSSKIIWPVLLMGSHSVMPWTMPNKTDLSNSSTIFIDFSYSSCKISCAIVA